MAVRKGSGRWLLTILLGVLLCLNDRFQPLRLKSMELDGFAPDLEWALRNWSESFLAFHPAWLLARQELGEIERQYPLTISAHWSPLRGRLTLTAVPFEPAMKLTWRHSEYLASADGTAWQSELWHKALNLEPPDVPTLDVGSSFPLLDDAAAAPARLRVSVQWLAGVRRTLDSQDGLNVSGLELIRRGGEDLVRCRIKNEKNGNEVFFLGRVSGLEKSLLVVRELTRGKSSETTSVDATYEDKIIIKRRQ